MAGGYSLPQTDFMGGFAQLGRAFSDSMSAIANAPLVDRKYEQEMQAADELMSRMSNLEQYRKDTASEVAMLMSRATDSKGNPLYNSNQIQSAQSQILSSDNPQEITLKYAGFMNGLGLYNRGELGIAPIFGVSAEENARWAEQNKTYQSDNPKLWDEFSSGVQQFREQNPDASARDIEQFAAQNYPMANAQKRSQILEPMLEELRVGEIEKKATQEGKASVIGAEQMVAGAYQDKQLTSAINKAREVTSRLSSRMDKDAFVDSEDIDKEIRDLRKQKALLIKAADDEDSPNYDAIQDEIGAIDRIIKSASEYKKAIAGKKVTKEQGSKIRSGVEDSVAIREAKEEMVQQWNEELSKKGFTKGAWEKNWEAFVNAWKAKFGDLPPASDGPNGTIPWPQQTPPNQRLGNTNIPSGAPLDVGFGGQTAVQDRTVNLDALADDIFSR